MKLRIVMLLIAGIAWLAIATPAQAQVWVTDTVGPIPEGATYIITPGYWTKDAVVIGVTFPHGDSIPPPPNPKSDTIQLPEEPNDFHYIGDVYVDPLGNITIISAIYIWGPFGDIPIGPIIVGDGSVPNLEVDIELDYTVNPADPTITIDKDAVEVYSGLYSALVLADYQLMTIGDRGCSYVPIPTTSEWGLIVLTLLILTAGTVVIARRRQHLAT